MNNNLIKRVQNSGFGKIVRRIVGEESGQAMMEYVLIAVLVAAASAVAIWYFGRATQTEAIAASHAVMGDETAAEKTITDGQGKVSAGASAAITAAKGKIVTKTEGALDVK